MEYAPTANGSDTANLTASAPNTTGASDSLSGASAWQNGDLTTVDQSVWGDPTSTSASLLTNNFNSVYQSTFGTLEVGVPGTGGFSISFSGAPAVIAYLPQIGTVGALDADLADPTTSSSGAFGGEATALRLNVDYSDAGLLSSSAGLKFGDLTVCGLTSDPDLNGETARQIEAVAETALGGGTTTDSISDIYTITANLNDSFANGALGAPSTWAQQHLVNGPCP